MCKEHNEKLTHYVLHLPRKDCRMLYACKQPTRQHASSSFLASFGEYFTKMLEDNLKALVKSQYMNQIPKAVRGAVGSRDLSVREGINIFLDGFVPTENVRFRTESYFQNHVRHLLHDKIRDAYVHPQFIADVMKPMKIEEIMDQEVQKWYSF
ncbi:hypothetical protein KR059_011651 [Drosophila kikkawai]|nr:hypothetical protein KR059_011651 [Drosophila kikkawai]